MDAQTNHVLLVSIHHMIYPITAEILHQIFDPYGFVEDIALIQRPVNFQALIQFQNLVSATSALKTLHGRYIYEGCCRLDIQAFIKLPDTKLQREEHVVLESEVSEVDPTEPRPYRLESEVSKPPTTMSATLSQMMSNPHASSIQPSHDHQHNNSIRRGRADALIFNGDESIVDEEVKSNTSSIDFSSVVVVNAAELKEWSLETQSCLIDTTLQSHLSTVCGNTCENLMVVKPPAKPPDVFIDDYFGLNVMRIILRFKNLFVEYEDGESGRADVACLLFDEKCVRAVVSWSTMYRNFSKNGRYNDVLEFIIEMFMEGGTPSKAVVVSMFNLFADLVKLRMGKSWRCYVIRNLKDMITDSWNVMIAGYVRCKKQENAARMRSRMLDDNGAPNDIFMLSSVIECGFAGAVEFGKQVHTYIVRNTFHFSVTLALVLVDMYGKCFRFKAVKTSLDNDFSPLSVNICKSFGLSFPLRSVLGLSFELHKCVIQAGTLERLDMLMLNSLVDMYGKCHRMYLAVEVFSELDEKNICSGTSMIVGCALGVCRFMVLEFLLTIGFDSTLNDRKKGFYSNKYEIKGEKRCGTCMDVAIDRGVLDCCEHWFCFFCIDNLATFTNLIQLCQNEFHLVSCVPVYDTIESNKGKKESGSREYECSIEEKRSALSFPSYYIDENAVVCLDGDGRKLQSRLESNSDDPNMDTSIAFHSCELWYHAFCMGFDTSSTSESTWLCPKGTRDEQHTSNGTSVYNPGDQLILSHTKEGSWVESGLSSMVSVSIVDNGETVVVVNSQLKEDCKLYTTLISTWAKCGKVDRMIEVFHEMVNAKVYLYISIYTSVQNNGYEQAESLKMALEEKELIVNVYVDILLKQKHDLLVATNPNFKVFYKVVSPTDKWKGGKWYMSKEMERHITDLIKKSLGGALAKELKRVMDFIRSLSILGEKAPPECLRELVGIIFNRVERISDMTFTLDDGNVVPVACILLVKTCLLYAGVYFYKKFHVLPMTGNGQNMEVTKEGELPEVKLGKGKYVCITLVLGLRYLVRISKFLMFSLPRPPEIADLEDKVNFKGRGMIQTYGLSLALG